MEELKRTLKQREFLAWIEFYKQQPFDDMHRYHRPAALITSAMSAIKTDDALAWLAPQPASTDEPEGLSKADLATLAAFKIKPRRKG